MNIPQIIKISGVVESVKTVNGAMQITFMAGITIAVDVNAAQSETIEQGDAVCVDFVERTVTRL